MKYLLAFNIGILLTFGVIHPEWNYSFPNHHTITRIISFWILVALVVAYIAEWYVEEGDDE